MKKKRLFFYLIDFFPRFDACDGSSILNYTNLRAYYDLGYEIEVIYLQTDHRHPFDPDDTLPGVEWTHLFSPSRAIRNFPLRIAYHLGLPARYAFDYYFSRRQQIRQVLVNKATENPNALHHIDNLATATCAGRLKDLKWIWSPHDIESELRVARIEIDKDLGRARRISDRTQIRVLKKAEHFAASRSKLMLIHAWQELEEIRSWGKFEHAQYFPMSWTDEHLLERKRQFGQDGKLILFHIGSVDALASYRSLEFIIQEVFPRISETIRSRVELWIVGKFSEHKRSVHIRQLADVYPNIKILGFQKNSKQYYACADLQLVGSTVATGIRTRIVESFVYGLPVLSTPTGAQGLLEIRDGENILLAASADEFAAEITDIALNPNKLESIAKASRKTYNEHMSRAVTAKRLRKLLHKFTLLLL